MRHKAGGQETCATGTWAMARLPPMKAVWSVLM